MHTLPTLTSTYLRTFKLYAISFKDVLPFILLLMICKYFINKFIPAENTVNTIFFARLMLDIALTALFFSFIMDAVYQKYYQGKTSPWQISLRGIKRFVQVFCAYLFISLPILITLGIVELANRFWMPVVITPDVAEKHLWISLSLIAVALFINLMLFVFSFAAGLFIVIEQENFIKGLLHSWKVVHPVWVDTLLLIILFGIINFSLTILLDTFHIPYAYLITTMLLTSLYPALMVIHVGEIEKLPTKQLAT
ncbi:MAG: hypothetical protein JSR17_10535 [Proteobacteria bacterium]|nr:hypothetical protein [Pseudomonadota bacterium]